MAKKTTSSKKTAPKPAPEAPKRYIVSLDTETTGLDRRGEDHIIQLACVKIDPDMIQDPALAVVKKKQWLIIPASPSWKIDKSAQEIHGITREKVLSDGIPWKEAAEEFLAFIEGCDILTYNGNKFDISFIYNDLREIGLDFPMDRVFYDSFQMEILLNPRDLTSIYKKYTGKDLEGAHDALADACAAAEVFCAQVNDGPLDLEQWSQMKENHLLTPDGTIRDTAPSGQKPCIVFSVGKYRDREFCGVLKEDPGYVQWFSRNVCSPYTWKVLQAYYKRCKEEGSI